MFDIIRPVLRLPAMHVAGVVLNECAYACDVVYQKIASTKQEAESCDGSTGAAAVQSSEQSKGSFLDQLKKGKGLRSADGGGGGGGGSFLDQLKQGKPLKSAGGSEGDGGGGGAGGGSFLDQIKAKASKAKQSGSGAAAGGPSAGASAEPMSFMDAIKARRR